MTGPLARAGAIPLMEDAVHLLRQAPLSTLLCHWAGSVPFALALLRYWNDVTNSRTPDVTCALESAGLTVLLVWMNCWRAVFAGRLRRALSGSGPAQWTRRRIVRLAASQAFLGAAKLVVMPLSLLVVFPLAGAMSFFRYAAVLADREELDPAQVIARARRLAGLQKGQGWAVLAILIFLDLVLLINLTLALGLLPQLVRMLTGYESELSRSGRYFVQNPLFALLVFAVSWIAFDPFVQAVYCVRCFRAESIETGEDLRTGLRLIRKGVQAAAVLLLLAGASRGVSAAVAPGDLEKSVQQTMQAHEYDWRLPAAAESEANHSWLRIVAEHVMAVMRAVTHAIGKAIGSFFDWLFPHTMPDPRSGAFPSRGLHWSVYVAMGAVISAAAWILWRKRRLRRAKQGHAAGTAVTAIQLEAEDLTPDLLPEERWMSLADECLREGNMRLALRALYLANLAWLGRAGFLSIHPGKTNREYELELRRRARAATQARGLFARNVSAFERAWYGMHEVAGEDIGQFRERFGAMKTGLAV